VLEVTLRTPGAIDAIRRMRSVEGAIVGAGTVLNERQLDDVGQAGAQFIVSPGLTKGLSKAVARSGIPYLPGVATAADIMRGLDLGLDRFKFFPAETSGGMAGVKALSGPFGNIRFCPTGGIRPGNAADWLALDTVLCVGGTWLYRRGDSMDQVRERARAAAALKGETSR
jgi:2-dehydro-3-deoxyphosphogluconate aldolase/(4S)-4-hydroxy-2-oxoglutarate aldolase